MSALLAPSIIRPLLLGSQQASVLVCDDSRAVLEMARLVLQDLGAGDIGMVDGSSAALRALAARTYDLVMLDYNLGDGPSGQQLLEHIRQQGLTKRRTVVMMLTGERSYSRVMQVAELAADDYVLKPFSSDVLGEKLARQMARVRLFGSTYDALDEKAFAAARELLDALPARLDAPMQIERERLRFTVLHALGRLDDAKQVVDRAIGGGDNAPRWALQERANLLRQAGEHEAAVAAYQAVTRAFPHFVPPRDALYELALQRDDVTAAITALKQAAALSETPDRLRKLGELHLSLCQPAEAQRHYERATDLARYSFYRDPHDLALLAGVAMQLGDTDTVLRRQGELRRQLEQTTESTAAGQLLALAQARQYETDPEAQPDVAALARVCAGLPVADAVKRPGVELLRARLLEEAGGGALARERLERVCEAHPPTTQRGRIAHEALATLKVTLDRAEPAIDEVRAQRAIDRNNDAAKLLAAGRIREALEQFELAIVDLPTDSTIILNAARARLALFAQKPNLAQFSAARELIKRAMRYQPDPEYLQTLRSELDAAARQIARREPG
jgi:DNA-binding response OmpR family regulator